MTTQVAATGPDRYFAATVDKQCRGFMIGSALFALGSAPGFVAWAGSSAANVSFFVGAWFFTGAALIQLVLSGDATTEVSGRKHIRTEWLSSATQFGGTLLFNVSTAAALHADTVVQERRQVWTPDAAGSVAFLVSGVLAVLVFAHAVRIWAPGRREWWAVQINLLGCIAFGVSAVGAYVDSTGVVISQSVANTGTFVGAVCFWLSAALTLPRWDRD